MQKRNNYNYTYIYMCVCVCFLSKNLNFCREEYVETWDAIWVFGEYYRVKK